MNFTTEEIAGLLGSGHHGPACRVDRVVIDPEQVRDGDGQLFAAFAHPNRWATPPLYWRMTLPPTCRTSQNDGGWAARRSMDPAPR